MSALRQKLTATFLSFCLCTGGLFCSRNSVQGPGTGSETTNGFSAEVRYQDGMPAAYASVKIRPADFLKDTPDGEVVNGAGAVADTKTDSLGCFSLLDIDTIDYTIEVLDARKHEGILLRDRALQNGVLDYGIVYLNPVGSIDGSIDTAALPEDAAVYLQIYGLDRVEPVDRTTGTFNIDDLAVGRYTVRLFTRKASYLPFTIENVEVVPSVVTMLDTIALLPLSAWCCTQNIFLNTTPAGADVAVTITRFPVLLRLTNENFDFTAAQPDGRDIRFIKPDNTTLPYDIERWEPENGRAEVWVKIDTVFGNDDTHSFIMLWGNPDAASEENEGRVFDTTMGFEGVWHMNDSDGVAVNDATGNRFGGRKYAMGVSSVIEGVCGTAQLFNGDSGYIVLSNTASGKLNFPEDGVYSISAWVYAEELDGNYHSIISKGNQQYGLQVTNENEWQFFEFQNRAGWDGTETGAVAGTWKYLAGVRKGDRQYLYVDGELVDSTITNVEGATNRITSDNVFIGRRTLDTTRYWKGMIDEVRICRWAHSVNWIRLCYMNQKAENRLVEFREAAISKVIGR